MEFVKNAWRSLVNVQWNDSEPASHGRTHEAASNTRTHEVESNADGSHNNSAKAMRDTVDVMPHPVKLISKTDTGKWQVNDEVSTFLAAHNDFPICSISTVGKYRTGKSYLNNLLFGKPNGFQLGSTVEAQTKGIWIWARTHPVRSGELLVILDTEGLLDVEEGDEKHDAELFILAILLSKGLIINVKETLDAATLKELSFIANLTNRIIEKLDKSECDPDGSRKDNSDDDDYFKQFFPKLFFLVRDFQLGLEYAGQAHTGDEYLERALSEKVKKTGRTLSQEEHTFNSTRQCIRDVFPARKCFTIPRPVTDDRLLKVMGNFDLFAPELTPDFSDAMSRCINTLYEDIRTFVIGGSDITGTGFLDMAKAYVSKINNGGTPDILSTAALFLEKERNIALEAALKIYQDELDKREMPVESDSLNQIHVDARDKASATLFKKVKAQKNNEKVLQAFMKEIEVKLEDFRKRNSDASSARCKELLQDYHQEIFRNLKADKYSQSGGSKLYKADRNELLRKYDEHEGKGPMADIERQKFLCEKETEFLSIVKSDDKLTEADIQKAIADESNRKKDDEKKALENELKQKKAEINMKNEEKLKVEAEQSRRSEELKMQLEKQKLDHKAKMAQREQEHKENLMQKEKESHDLSLKHEEAMAHKDREHEDNIDKREKEHELDMTKERNKNERNQKRWWWQTKET